MSKRAEGGPVLRSATTQWREGGFTLIEVLVALAVAGGALVLVLSANAASLGRSARARVDARLERAAESKLAELRIGAETASEGPLAGFDGHRWAVRGEVLREGPKGLFRRILTVAGTGGVALLERSELVRGAR